MKKAYKYLTVDDRTLIQTQLKEGFKPASATRPAERSAMAGGYSSIWANLRVRRLSATPLIGRKLAVGNPLWEKVIDGLQQGLSPEQIADTLQCMGEPIRLCHETIYQAINIMPKGELRTEIYNSIHRGMPYFRSTASNSRLT